MNSKPVWKIEKNCFTSRCRSCRRDVARKIF